ncbi:MAG: hypothetical protein ACKVQQ_19930 [Burkholderiales bacterium]
MNSSSLPAVGMSRPVIANDTGSASTQPLVWLPRARWARLAVFAMLASTLGLTFAAWLSPNMVFDFANLVFCG